MAFKELMQKVNTTVVDTAKRHSSDDPEKYIHFNKDVFTYTDTNGKTHTLKMNTDGIKYFEDRFGKGISSAKKLVAFLIELEASETPKETQQTVKPLKK